MRSVAGFWVVVSLLAGCQTTTGGNGESAAVSSSSGAVNRTLYEDVYRLAFDVSLLESVADECRDLVFSQKKRTVALQQMREDLLGRSYTQSDLKTVSKSISDARIQKDVFAYFGANGIVVTQPETFCTAGKREIARHSRVGSFLSSRR